VAAHEALLKGKKSIAISPEPLPPVWMNKEETDKCYNECAKALITKIKEDVENSSGVSKKNSLQGPRIGVLFGTHNWTSTKLILKQLVKSGLASIQGDVEEGVVTVPDEVTERLTMGQLFGMCFQMGFSGLHGLDIHFAGMNDALSDYIVQRTRSNAPMVIK
jgi:proline dehydrogenase